MFLVSQHFTDKFPYPFQTLVTRDPYDDNLALRGRTFTAIIFQNGQQNVSVILVTSQNVFHDYENLTDSSSHSIGGRCVTKSSRQQHGCAGKFGAAKTGLCWCSVWWLRSRCAAQIYLSITLQCTNLNFVRHAVKHLPKNCRCPSGDVNCNFCRGRI